MENNQRMSALFGLDYDIERIIRGLRAESRIDIQHSDTLIILDEIQEIPQAVESLKYFQEHPTRYDVIAAGSFLGLTLHLNISFPVGKVEFLQLKPLSFHEFLLAQQQVQLLEALQTLDYPLVQTFKTRYVELLQTYFFVGGMPEVVSIYNETQSWQATRDVQISLLDTYRRDLGKHAPSSLVPKIAQTWENIPTQLAKENRKFIYGLIKQGARAREYGAALNWLSQAGLIYQIYRSTAPKFPINSYRDLQAFKIFTVDLGLLNALSGLGPEVLLMPDQVFTEFKGALTEQFVLQELKVFKNLPVSYWSGDKNSTAEVDFLIQTPNRIIPIEVKAKESLQSKSLKFFHQRFNSKISIRTSLSDFRQNDWLTNVPLYLLSSNIDYLLKSQTRI